MKGNKIRFCVICEKPCAFRISKVGKNGKNLIRSVSDNGIIISYNNCMCFDCYNIIIKNVRFGEILKEFNDGRWNTQ